MISSAMAARLQPGPDSEHGLMFRTLRGDWLIEFEKQEDVLAVMFEVLSNIILNKPIF